ncbi:MAG TPA: Fic family protein [Polyangia bacterium]|jgi:Fic family protein
MEVLREKLTKFPRAVTKDYQDRLDVSWLFHDNALEGVVLSYSELKAAIDQRIISDVTLIPMYEEVRLHKQALDWVREVAPPTPKLTGKKQVEVDLELVRKLYAMLTPEAASKGHPYRKENPLHRLYYHEIAAPDKIAPKMKKLAEWLESDEFNDLHPVRRATKAHFKLLTIYPWTKNSGKVARLLMNFILLRHGHLPAVVHSIERQRYYEALRFDNETLLNLILESMDNSIETTSRFFTELSGLRIRRAS